MAKFNFEEYRQPWETGAHWELKREFMEAYQNDFSEDRLLCLAQAYSNIELLNASYPAPVMLQVHELSKSLNGCKGFREMKKNFPETGSTSGKRTYTDNSNKPVKFIKFSTSDKNEASPPPAITDLSSTRASNSSINPIPRKELPPNIDLDNKSITDINMNLLLYIRLGPDYELIKKIAEKLTKIQDIDSRSRYLFTAIENAGLQKMVTYNFSNSLVGGTPLCVCKFLVGNTILAIGRDNNKQNSLTNASAFAIEILTNVNNLPMRLLTDAITDINIAPQITAMTDSDLCFIEKFAKEVKKYITKDGVKQVITIAATKLNCLSDVAYINYGEDLDTGLAFRAFRCNLVIKNILISHGKGDAKKKASDDAALVGILNLITFLENKEHPGTQRQENNEKALTNKELLQHTNILDFLLGASTVITLSKSKRVRENILERFKGIQENIHVLVQVLEKHSDPIPIPESKSPPILNKYLLDNSLQQEFALFDVSEVFPKQNQTPVQMLTYASSVCKKSLTYVEEIVPGTTELLYKCDLLLGGKVIATGTGVKKEAKLQAQTCALQKLRNQVYTIKLKNEAAEGFVVQRANVMNADTNSKVVSESNIGHKMLKMMGWSGGGIGKTGGITEPITAGEHRRAGEHQGLGSITRLEGEKEFKQKLEEIIMEYINSSTIDDLIFSLNFPKIERAVIHSMASRFNLLSSSRGKGKDRQLFLRKRLTVNQILSHVVEAGGSTHKYELIDMSAATS